MRNESWPSISSRSAVSYKMPAMALLSICYQATCCATLFLHLYLILLQLAVGHFVGPCAQVPLRKSYPINSLRHSTTQFLTRLSELERCAQIRQPGGKIFQSGLAEVKVGIVGKK